jgi:hypothetical protein
LGKLIGVEYPTLIGVSSRYATTKKVTTADLRNAVVDEAGATQEPPDVWRKGGF